MDEHVFNAINEWIKKYISNIGYSIPLNEKLPFTLAELTYWMMNTREHGFDLLSSSYYAISLLLVYQTKSGSNLLFQMVARQSDKIPRSVDYYISSRSEYAGAGGIRSLRGTDQYSINPNWDVKHIEKKVDEVYNQIGEKNALSKDEIKNAFKVNTKLRMILLGNIKSRDKFFDKLTTHTINIGNKKVHLKTQPVTLPTKLNKTGKIYNTTLNIIMERPGYSNIKLCNIIKSTEKIKMQIWRLIVENGQFADYSIVVKNIKFEFCYDEDLIKITLPVELQLIKAKDYGETIGALVANLSHISRLQSDTQKLSKLKKLADQLGVNVNKFTEVNEMYNYLDDYILKLNYDDFDVQTS